MEMHTKFINTAHEQVWIIGDVAKKYQLHLWHKIWQNLTGIDTCENIRLI